MSSAGIATFVKSLETGVDGCHCEIHLLPCFDGWIVEIWNWLAEWPELVARVALPRLLQTTAELSTLLRLASRS